jgi:hypothetical protein
MQKIDEVLEELTGKLNLKKKFFKIIMITMNCMFKPMLKKNCLTVPCSVKI